MHLRIAALTAVVLTVPAAAQQNVEIGVVPVADGIHMLTGRGGNIGVSSGPDGVFLIDDQYAPLTEQIVAAIRTFADGPIRFVLNTHWHGDHTGGNEHLGERGAIIVAHDNVRERMSAEQMIFGNSVAPAPEGALPVVTFSETVTFHLNGHDVHVLHVPHAHTDGDAVIHFRSANTFHMGDLLFNGNYPFIDLENGGMLQGVISGVRHVLDRADDESRIIPGHGPLATRADLVGYLEMLEAARERVQAMIDEGASLEDVQAAKPMADRDEDWGGGFINPDQFLGFVYRSLAMAGAGQ